MTPLVSLIVVSNKPHFSEAVLRSYHFQDYPNKELVIVDASEHGTILRDEADVYVRGEWGENVGPLRNLGLEAARGEWFMWFDDDDWRHPTLVSDLMGVAKHGGVWCSALRNYHWINLDGRMERQGCRRWPVFGAAVYWNGPDLPRFRPYPEIKTDSWWLVRMKSTQEGEIGLLSKPFSYGWVYHGDNLSNMEYPVDPFGMVETDARFFPGEEWGLRAHMELIRSSVRETMR